MKKLLLSFLLLAGLCAAQNQPVVYLRVQSTGNSWTVGGDKIPEMQNDMNKYCAVQFTERESASDYTVSLRHQEFGLLIRTNVVTVSNAKGIMLQTAAAPSIDVSMRIACGIILPDFAKNAPPPEAPPTAAEPPAESAAPVAVQITSTPPGADILIDGNFYASTPSSVAVPAGTHAVTIQKEGYKPWTRTLTVVLGSNVTISADLGAKQ